MTMTTCGREYIPVSKLLRAIADIIDRHGIIVYDQSTLDSIGDQAYGMYEANAFYCDDDLKLISEDDNNNIKTGYSYLKEINAVEKM